MVFFVFIIFPLCAFIHEVGHAVFALRYTTGNVTINIGINGDLFDFSIGRLKVNICKIFFVGGNTLFQKPNSFKNNLLILLGGPMFTLAQSILTFILLLQLSYRQFYAYQFVFMTFIISIMFFLSSIIPMEYNDIGFSRIKSDGLQLQNLMKSKKRNF